MLALGTMRETLEGCAVKDAVKMWLRLGGRHLDLSKWYGTEKEVAEGLKAAGVLRKDVFLTAKVEGPIGYESTLRQVATYDLPNMGVDYFDLLLIHTPCVSYADFPNKCGLKDKQERLDTWRALEHLKAMGKVRAIGVSNFAMSQLQQLYHAGYHPAVNQVQWHLGYHNDTLLSAAMLGGTHIDRLCCAAVCSTPCLLEPPAGGNRVTELRSLASRCVNFRTFDSSQCEPEAATHTASLVFKQGRSLPDFC